MTGRLVVVTMRSLVLLYEGGTNSKYVLSRDQQTLNTIHEALTLQAKH